MKFLLSILILLLIVSTVDAKKLYKSVDERGRVSYSDKPPKKPTKKLTVSHLKYTKPEQRLFLKRRDGKNSAIFTVHNNYQGPMTLTITLSEAVNVGRSVKFPFTVTVPPNSNKKIFKLWRGNKRKGWKYRYSYRFSPGSPKAKHSPEKPYRVPFKFGEKYYISQAFFGKATHHVLGNNYAVDIVLPEGTPIVAARKGVVMDIANNFSLGGKKEKYKSMANYVRIIHDDGTMAIYAHLQLASIQVPIGSRVKEGQMIAKSGTTGYSSGPHLHFVIQKNDGKQLISVPFDFEGINGKGFIPQRGQLLVATP